MWVEISLLNAHGVKIIMRSCEVFYILVKTSENGGKKDCIDFCRKCMQSLAEIDAIFGKDRCNLFERQYCLQMCLQSFLLVCEASYPCFCL